MVKSNILELPGSKKAIDMGCLCPVIDNYYGVGFTYGGKDNQYWINEYCPLHTEQINNKEKK